MTALGAASGPIVPALAWRLHHWAVIGEIPRRLALWTGFLVRVILQPSELAGCIGHPTGKQAIFNRTNAFAVFVVAAVLGPPQSSYAEIPDANPKRAILVTGASTGIGRNIAETLAASGYFVYAGARKPADLDALDEIPNIQAIRLDVTRQDEIDAAVETVRAGGKGLYGLVNNAGVATAGPIVEIDEDELAWILDVNLMGVFRVTKAFAPLIIESKGRISNISSISGVISNRFWAAYQMSKHALEAYTDTLALELALFDVKVSAINNITATSANTSCSKKVLLLINFMRIIYYLTFKKQIYKNR